MTAQASRVSELSTGTGTGTLVMTGAVIGYRSFTAAYGTGNTEVYYGIIQDGTGEWEVGIGTYLGGSHAMQRDTVLAGSNGTSKVTFPAGDKIIYSTFPAESTLTLQSRRSADVGLTIKPAAGQTAPLIQVLNTGGVVSVSAEQAGRVTISGSLPEFRMWETDQTAPAGQYGFVVSGGQFSMRRFTAAGFTGTDTFLTYNPATDTLALTAGNLSLAGAISDLNLVNPTLSPASFADNQTAATIGIERAWVLVQQGSGATAGLELRADVAGSKTLRIVDSTRATGFQFWPSLSSISALSQPDILFNDQVTAPRLDIANIDASFIYFRDAAGNERGALYASDVENVVLRNANSLGRVIISPAGVITLAGTLAGISFGTRTAAARTNMTDHIELHTSGYGITVTSASLNFIFNNGAAAYYVDKDGSTHAIIDQEGTPSSSSKTVITREKGDARYPTLTVPNFYEQTQTIAADGTVGWRVYNAAKTLERANMFATGSNFAIRNTGLTAATTCQFIMEAGGDFNLNVGRYVGDGGGITNLSAAAVGIGAAAVPADGIGDFGIFRTSATSTAIAWGANFAAASLRRAGISTADTGWTVDVEGAGNVAPALGTWQSRSAILARTGHYSIGLFKRVL